MKNITLAVLAVILMSCASHAPSGTRTPIDLLPMYGGIDRQAVAALKSADERLVRDATAKFGTRERASAEFAQKGFTLYQLDDAAGAMRRFNQAWVLDPDNPEVFWGFASVLHDGTKYCEAMEMIEKSLRYRKHIDGLYPDAARIIVRCTVSDGQLTAARKEERFRKADELYSEAVEKDRNKGHVYASWATSYYWRGRYADSWEMVGKARQAGANLPEPFLSMLRAKMPEPRR
ncbi:MAG TPA: hypothetical protein VNX25_07860 [Verrucomicrobiae bacterium]|nr:hypothetical protein [Verrucomicrobiae bacterium]